MKITKESAKAWKAEYEKINAMEREEMKERLPTMTIEQSLKTYFELCRFMIAISGSSDEPHELHELRARDRASLITKWKLLAERLGHVT
ncbi:MAG: hypothetical protein L0287_06805 [Anaerolineae bacterium]|nr:hypothetical protein [Anaerolineae bacterium]MCI0609279.1 hypothetical protein [Anaerolineae bacterium]